MVDKKKVILQCSECLSLNYTIHKSAGSKSERLELKKYCPKCKKVTLHRETR